MGFITPLRQKETLALLFLLIFLFVLMYFLEIRRAGYSIREYDTLDSCQPLVIPRQTYILTRDIEARATCFVILADNITLDLNNHVLRGDGDGRDVGVLVEGYNGAIVKNGIIQNFIAGVLLNDSSQSSILENQIENHADSGVVVFGGSGHTLQDNLFLANSYYGAKIISSSGNQILRNTFHENFDSGLFLQGSIGNVIADNIITENAWNGIALYRSHANLLQGNRVQRNFWNSLSFILSSRNTIFDHFLQRNARGIYLFSSDDNRFSDVEISNSSADTSLYLANSHDNYFQSFTLEMFGDDHYPISIISTGNGEASHNFFQDFSLTEGYNLYSRTGAFSSNFQNIFRNVNYAEEILTPSEEVNEVQREWWLEIHAFQGEEPVEALVEIQDHLGNVQHYTTSSEGYLKIPLLAYIQSTSKKETYGYQVHVIYEHQWLTKRLRMDGNRAEVFQF